MSRNEEPKFIPYVGRTRFQINMTVEVTQDMVPGAFHEIDSWVKQIEYWITSPVPHYDPVITINSASSSYAKLEAFRKFQTQPDEDDGALVRIEAPFIPEGVHRVSNGSQKYWTFSVSTPSIAAHISSMELCEFLNEYGMINDVPFHKQYKDGHYPTGAIAMSMMEMYCSLTCAKWFHEIYWTNRGHIRRT